MKKRVGFDLANDVDQDPLESPTTSTPKVTGKEFFEEVVLEDDRVVVVDQCFENEKCVACVMVSVCIRTDIWPLFVLHFTLFAVYTFACALIFDLNLLNALPHILYGLCK